MKKLIPIILVIALPIYILLFSLEINTFNINMFEKHIDKNNIEEATGKDKNYLMRVYEDLLRYLRGENVDISNHFNDREVKHMVDVERLFHYGFIIKRILFVVSVLSIIFIFYDKENLNTNLSIIFKGLFIWWIIVGVFFILSMFDFSKCFTYFHLIFFDNDLWLLDPNTDLMIQMLPEVFFISIFVKIIGVFLIGLLGLHLGVYFFRKKKMRLV